MAKAGIKRDCRLVLGAAQWGFCYGATNQTGMPDDVELLTILREAGDHGVSFIDTAPAYGSSEIRIGKALHELGSKKTLTIMTKLIPFENLNALSKNEIIALVRNSVEESCRRLCIPCLPWLLLHRAKHAWCREQCVLKECQRLCEEGLIENLGVSVYHPEEAHRCLDIAPFRAIQLPLNIFDIRHWREDVLARCVKENVNVFLRSAFLQGLLAHPEPIKGSWPDALMPLLVRYHKFSTEKGRTPSDIALAFCRAFPVTGIIVGMETPEQLQHNLRLFQNPSFSLEEALCISEKFSDAPGVLVNPSNW